MFPSTASTSSASSTIAFRPQDFSVVELVETTIGETLISLCPLAGKPARALLRGAHLKPLVGA